MTAHGQREHWLKHPGAPVCDCPPIDRTRYCHECGRGLAGPIAERTHVCDDRPAATLSRFTAATLYGIGGRYSAPKDLTNG